MVLVGKKNNIKTGASIFDQDFLLGCLTAKDVCVLCALARLFIHYYNTQSLLQYTVPALLSMTTLWLQTSVAAKALH